MTNVTFEKHNEKLISFKIIGHAGYDEFNKDIVCSGISAISQTIVNGIIEVAKVKADYEIDEDGFLSLTLKNLNDSDIEKCQILMETMLIGLKSMEINYGEYINVKIEEV